MFEPQEVPFDVYNGGGFAPEERAAKWIELSGAAAKKASHADGYYSSLVARDAAEGDKEQILKVRGVWGCPRGPGGQVGHGCVSA